MFRRRKSRSERINRINIDNTINLLNSQDFIGIPERSPRQEDEEKASEFITRREFNLDNPNPIFGNDLVIEDISDNFFGDNSPLTQMTNINKVKSTVGLLTLAGLSIGAGLAIKKKLSKKKEITKEDILRDVLNNKPIEELQGLVSSPENKTKEQLVKEIMNKII